MHFYNKNHWPLHFYSKEIFYCIFILKAGQDFLFQIFFSFSEYLWCYKLFWPKYHIFQLDWLKIRFTVNIAGFQ